MLFQNVLFICIQHRRVVFDCLPTQLICNLRDARTVRAAAVIRIFCAFLGRRYRRRRLLVVVGSGTATAAPVGPLRILLRRLRQTGDLLQQVLYLYVEHVHFVVVLLLRVLELGAQLVLGGEVIRFKLRYLSTK